MISPSKIFWVILPIIASNERISGLFACIVVVLAQRTNVKGDHVSCSTYGLPWKTEAQLSTSAILSCSVYPVRFLIDLLRVSVICQNAISKGVTKGDEHNDSGHYDYPTSVTASRLELFAQA